MTAIGGAGVDEHPIPSRAMVVALIGIWALIGLQRFAPGFMAPFVIAEFPLTNTQWGIVTGVLAFSWASGAMLAGVFTDRVGPKPIIVTAGLISGLLGWSVGLVQSLVQLVSARLCLGVAEGALWPSITTALTRLVGPARSGVAVSALIACFLIVGVSIGAPLVTYLGQTVGWRASFFVVSAPLLLVTTFVWWRLAPVTRVAAEGPVTASGGQPRASLWIVLRNRNVVLSALIAVCFISRLFIINAFGVLYLHQIHGLPIAAAGALLGPSLFGDVVGTLVFGWLADRTGWRRGLVFLLCAGATIAGVTFAMLPAGTPVAALAVSLFAFTLCAGGVFPLMLVVLPSEAVGDQHAATAIGLVNFCGECFGAGLSPIAGGMIADALDLRYTVLLAGCLAAVAALLSLGLCARQAPHQGDSA